MEAVISGLCFAILMGLVLLSPVNEGAQTRKWRL